MNIPILELKGHLQLQTAGEFSAQAHKQAGSFL